MAGFDEVAKRALLAGMAVEKHKQVSTGGRNLPEYRTEAEMKKWYAVQVMTGKEDATCTACRRVIRPQILGECFMPKYERMRRYLGQWHKEERPMFPGYLFFITDQIGQLHYELKRLPQLTKILGNGAEFIPLKDEEIRFLEQMEDERHLIRMSEGYIVGEKVIVNSGPMQEMVGNIRKIDRHKRIATVQVEMFGRQMDVVMGLEIVRKMGANEIASDG